VVENTKQATHDPGWSFPAHRESTCICQGRHRRRNASHAGLSAESGGGEVSTAADKMEERTLIEPFALSQESPATAAGFPRAKVVADMYAKCAGTADATIPI
jgi:hypothetical protein